MLKHAEYPRQEMQQNMFLMRISNHRQLQNMAQTLTDNFTHEDPFVLRSAILEVLQNTVQHSDGRFGLLITSESIIVTSLPRNGKNNNHHRSNLGLKLYKGVKTSTKGELFITELTVPHVSLSALDMEKILNNGIC